MVQTDIIAKLDEIKAITLIGVKNVLTLDEASLYVGVSADRLRHLASNKQAEIPSSICRDRLYFAKKDLDEYLTRNRRMSHYEVEAEAVRIINRNNSYKRKKLIS